MYKILNKTFTKLPTEEAEQKELVVWLKKCGFFFFATNNENNSYKQNRKYAMIAEVKARATGKLKGTLDLCVFGNDKIFFIELKRQKPILKSGKLGTPKNKPTVEQEAFLLQSNKYEYCVSFVAYGADDAINQLKEHKALEAN